MNYDDCSHLDAFLLGDLDSAAASRFNAHLNQCETCRDAVEEQRWIDGLLTSPIGSELESPPERLIDTFHQTVDSRRRRTRLVACVFATAAAVAIAAGWIVLNRQASVVDAPGGVAVNTADHDADLSTPQKHTEPPRATFVGGSDVLVVPVTSRHTNVTIVRVYPAYTPSYEAQTGAETFDLDQYNGG